MEIKVLRFLESYTSTLGMLTVEGHHECFTLEDEYREVKVMDETRIPSGRYRIKLRTEGGMHKHYAARFSNHRGMLWLQDVPGFEWIYIHIGNEEDQTSGCILVGKGLEVDNGQRVTESALAYLALAEKIYTALDNGEEIWIEMVD